MAAENTTRPHPNFKDITGETFGYWKVGERAPNSPNGHVRYFVQCKCGTNAIRLANELRRPNGKITRGSKSCGCWGRERSKARIKHGHYSDNYPTPEYMAWQSAKGRCFNSSNKDYANYGGRGITMCDEWKNSFEAFLRDMGLRPSPKHSLDRYPNNNGAYEQGNCRWATLSQQRRNQRPELLPRRKRMITFGDETHTMKEWAKKIGLSYSALSRRINKHNLPVEIALSKLKWQFKLFKKSS